MAELEKKEVIDDENLNNEDVPDDNTTDDSEISYEQALEWKKKAERLEKAEKKVVELKKQSKKIEKKEDTPIINSKEELKQLLAEERFYDKNPDANSYREKIEEYQKKGLWLDDAYLLASREDKEIEKNREIYWKSFVKWEQTKTDISTVTSKEFEKMSTQAQEDYTNKMTTKYWKIKFKYS